MKIKVKKLKEGAKLPTYHHPGDIGMDLYSMETVTVAPGEHHRFWHGFALEFPGGFGGIIMDKGSWCPNIPCNCWRYVLRCLNWGCLSVGVTSQQTFPSWGHALDVF